MARAAHWSTALALVTAPVAATAAGALAAPPETRSEVSPRLDAWIEARLAAHGTPGAAVAIVQHGRVVHLVGYGRADPRGTPVTPDTPFLIGSVSKPFTAAVIEQLVAEGILAWDEPVWPRLAHLSGRSPAGFESATVEQLLVHTAGLGMDVGVAGAVRVHVGSDALDLRARDVLARRLAFPPGAGWEYSNAGPTLLAAVVEQATGRSFGDELRGRIFEPLGMTATFATAAAAAEARLATGHELWFGRWRPVDHPYDQAGAAMGYIGSTARDLAAFMQAHLRGHPAIASDAAIVADAPVHPTGWAVPLESGYGRGWFVDELAGHTVVSHSGSLGHFTAHVLLVPSADLGVAVLTNASAFFAAGHEGQYDLSIGLLRILLGEAPRPTGRSLMLTYLAPTLAWLTCLVVVALGVHPLLPQPTTRNGAPRTGRIRRRRLALGGVLLLVGAALLAAPLAPLRHFYPDAGLALTLLAPLSLAAGLLILIRGATSEHAVSRAGRRPAAPHPAERIASGS